MRLPSVTSIRQRCVYIAPVLGLYCVFWLMFYQHNYSTYVYNNRVADPSKLSNIRLYLNDSSNNDSLLDYSDLSSIRHQTLRPDSRILLLDSEKKPNGLNTTIKQVTEKIVPTQPAIKVPKDNVPSGYTGPVADAPQTAGKTVDNLSTKDRGLAIDKIAGNTPQHTLTDTNGSLKHGGNVSATNQTGESHGHFHVIVFFSIFGGEIWKNYENFTAEQRDSRDAEVIEALAYNLNHTLVENVHLFYHNDQHLVLLMKRKLHNMKKLVPVKLDRLIHMADFFRYASKNLIDKPVIAMNSDIVIGDGFETLDTIRMRENRIMFSLTRYGNINGRCFERFTCVPGNYKGSHDTYVFRLAQPMDEKILISKLDYPTNMWGAESGMMFVVQNYFKFKVRNPCLILKTHHNHCSVVHGPPNKKSAKYSIVNNPIWKITGKDIHGGMGLAAIEGKIDYSNPKYKPT